MDVQKARQIVSSTISGRKRWGKMFNSEYGIAEILDALVCLEEEVGLVLEAGSDDLTKSKRQTTASKAREAKLKKKVTKLEEQIAHLLGECPPNSKCCGE